MFEKNLKLSYLLDCYGSMLDNQTEGVLRAYLEDDLSLSEIASGLGISRQGVHHTVKKGEEALLSLESKLSLASLMNELSEIRDTLISVNATLSDSPSELNAKENISDVIERITRRLT